MDARRMKNAPAHAQRSSPAFKRTTEAVQVCVEIMIDVAERITDMRNLIVHEYGAIDPKILDDMLRFRGEIDFMIENEPEGGGPQSR
jgi:uncharacterized protein YutE (UPF0331/DUF86 family)